MPATSIRGLIRRQIDSLGNFWVDFVAGLARPGSDGRAAGRPIAYS
jgi:hypothetical protein